jgi:hypothetical protein
MEAVAVFIKTTNPSQLVVVGSVMTPGAFDHVALQLSPSPCFNPTILCLDLIIDGRLGPMKMTQKFFHYVGVGHDENYTKVQINQAQEGSVVLDIINISK